MCLGPNGQEAFGYEILASWEREISRFGCIELGDVSRRMRVFDSSWLVTPTSLALVSDSINSHPSAFLPQVRGPTWGVVYRET